MNTAVSSLSPLDRARRKAYWRLLPLVFVAYMVAYVDRSNVSIAKLTMSQTLPAFTNAVIGFGGGIFYLGYILLEIPGTLIVEKFGARRWTARIMVTWGIVAALTALVKTPHQFYTVRFILGLAEAGFFPGIIIYLTHWFPARDRSRALSFLIVAQSSAQLFSLKISGALMKCTLFGLNGWQWVYIFWGIPAVILGVVVWFALTDRPALAGWLTEEEKAALEQKLSEERLQREAGHRLTLGEALRNSKVLLLTLAYFCAVSASLGFELFMPSILKDWYGLDISTITWLAMLPPALAVVGILFIGWNSDRTNERRWHTLVPVTLSLLALAVSPLTRGGSSYALTVICFMIVTAGLKSYQPAFWSLPSQFLTGTAAAGCIGFINCIGNIGAFCGQDLIGRMQTLTHSFVGGLYWLCGSLVVFIAVIFCLGLGRREKPDA